MILPALAIKQPWASMIIHAGKDIENRTWPTRVRGRILIHASKKLDIEDMHAANDLIHERIIQLPHTCPLANFPIEAYPGGGIIGIAEIVDCVTKSDSPWFVGPYGFKLANVRPLPFLLARGVLGFFSVDYPDLEQVLKGE